MKSIISIHSKLPKVGTSIFAKMSALATQHQALNLAQGFPDFPIDERLPDLVYQAMKKGHNQYAPMPGLLSLREKIAEKTEKLYQAKYKPDTEITITAGATQALFTVISALVHDGDEVVVFNPAYDCYEPAIELAGGKTIHLDLKAPEFSIDFTALKKVLSRKTRAIIINSPHNPTGAILSEQDMKQLEKLVSNTDIVIISDEVYEHMVFDQEKHQSVCMYPKLAERSVVISSFGKTYHTTGWKMGYVLAPEAISAEFRKVHQFNVFCVNTPIQHAMSEALNYPEYYEHLSNFYQEKRDLFLKEIGASRFRFIPAKGTYFQCLDYSAISDQKDTDFANLLTEKHKIASIPTGVFYHKDHNLKLLRFCFAKSDDTLKRAAEILNNL